MSCLQIKIYSFGWDYNFACISLKKLFFFFQILETNNYYNNSLIQKFKKTHNNPETLQHPNSRKMKHTIVNIKISHRGKWQRRDGKSSWLWLAKSTVTSVVMIWSWGRCFKYMWHQWPFASVVMSASLQRKNNSAVNS